MADIRINALATTAASTASDDFIAIDGSANGTRKLNAYSPTFGGNLTVSGTGGVQLNSVANLTWGGSYGAGIPTIAIPSATSIGFYPTGSTSGKTFELFGTGNATLTGNLTVSGTGTSSVAGTIDVGTLPTSGRDVPVVAGFYQSSDFVHAVVVGRGGVANPQQLSLGVNQASTYSEIQATQAGVATNKLILNRQGGNVLIGTTTDGGQKLQVNGTAAIAGTATATRLIANSQWVAASAGTGALSATANAGVQLTGTGAVNDITLVNKNGDNVMVVPTGTTNATFAGAIAIGNTVNTVSPTSPNRTITMVIGGTTYYIHAKTTND